jgi:hypothetical protein
VTLQDEFDAAITTAAALVPQIDPTGMLAAQLGTRLNDAQTVVDDFVTENVPPNDNAALVGSRAHQEANPDHSAYAEGAQPIQWQWPDKPGAA